MVFLSMSQHNLVFIVLLKLTTCFGLCFRPSSGYKIYIHLKKVYSVIHKDRYMELKFSELWLNFNSMYLVSDLCFRPSSDHEIYIHLRKLYSVSHKARYMELKFSELSLNFNSMCLAL
jgi:hypothetical protein